ncbi:unnamed protein product [Somion occarium]|uniref:RING-type domain-containing protein n=1 Tax=Somion occarium TaxID=3059160 RepID=A0ABP1DKL6_9APHY
MSFTYVGSINDNLICCICRATFIDPCTTRTCSHTFCRECITTALSVSPTCPVDRSPLTVEDLILADPVVRNLVNELLVECPNKAAGCRDTPQRQLLDAHLRGSCEYMKAEDTTEDVGSNVVSKETLEAHLDEGQPSAESSAVRCSLCQERVPRSSLSSHIPACQDTVVSCTHASNGCSWEGRRSDLSGTHIPSCPYESIKGFFAIHEQKVSSLKAENDVLKHKVEQLEGLVRVLTRESGILKEALGPWYRAGSSGSVPSSSFQSYNDQILRPNAGYATSTTPANARYPDQASPFDVEYPDQMDSLASYFPRLEEDEQYASPQTSTDYQLDRRIQPPVLYLPRSLHPQSAYHVPHSGPSSSHQPQPPSHPSLLPLPTATITTSTSTSTPTLAPGPPPSAITPTSPIAPLNLSGNLFGALTSLHNSLTTLSSSVDSLARQHEVHIATEAMRNTEELRSLRTVLHGLRMQVHSIMMDRNAQMAGRPGGEGQASGPEINDPRDGPWIPPFPIPRFPHSSVSPGPVTKL